MSVVYTDTRNIFASSLYEAKINRGRRRAAPGTRASIRRHGRSARRVDTVNPRRRRLTARLPVPHKVNSPKRSSSRARGLPKMSPRGDGDFSLATRNIGARGGSRKARVARVFLFPVVSNNTWPLRSRHPFVSRCGERRLLWAVCG